MQQADEQLVGQAQEGSYPSVADDQAGGGWGLGEPGVMPPLPPSGPAEAWALQRAL